MPRTLPGRIILGFAVLVLLFLLFGGIVLSTIMALNRNIETVTENSVPSLFTLNRVIQADFATTRVMRRMLLDAKEGVPVPDEGLRRFADAKAAGDANAAEYEENYIIDEDDRRSFTAATAARQTFLAKLETVAAAARAGRIEEGKSIMLKDLDPLLDGSVEAFSRCVDFNRGVAERQTREADRTMRWSHVIVIAGTALAALLGSLLGAGIIRSATRTLGAVSGSLEAGARQTTAASNQLASSSQALAEGCSEQGSAVEETSAAIEEMSAMIRTTADNAERATSLAAEARAAAQSGAGTMREMNDAMRAIAESSEEVAKIVRNIDEIAFQTNILALNAAVEAARAGDAGAGFAVVADEVRSLAQRSATAAKETAARIDAAIADSRRGSATCDRVGESLDAIVEKVLAADGLVAEIATAAKEQAQGIRQVTAAIAQMDQVTHGNASRAEESAGAAEELKAQAGAMERTVTLLRSLVGGGRRDDAAAEPASPAPRLPGGTAPRRLPGPSRPQPERIPMPQPRAAGDDEDRHFRAF